MLELKREFNCSFDFKKPFLHLKFSLSLYEFTLQCRRSFGSLYNGVFTWENSHQRKFHIRMTFRFLITFTWWLGHSICLYVDKIHVCSKSQTLRMRYPFQSTNRPISHRSKCSFRVYMIPLRDFVPEWNSRPGATTGVNSRRGDSRRHDIFWWYHVNKCRAMRGNRNELTPARKSPRCRVNSPSFRSWSGVCVLLDNPKVNTTSGMS